MGRYEMRVQRVGRARTLLASWVSELCIQLPSAQRSIVALAEEEEEEERNVAVATICSSRLSSGDEL